MLQLKYWIRDFRELVQRDKDNHGSLAWLTQQVLSYRNGEPFKFVEIGVFKGDNAVKLLRLAKKFNVDSYYVGFDLFEDIDEFFASHPEDRKLYDLKEYPYWEFSSGQHALDQVTRKIASILPIERFSLIKGDSTLTVPAYRSHLDNASLIYIDGCHDYDIVLKDWENVSETISRNPNVVIVFDDATYEGVSQVRAEIEALEIYKVFFLNFNQFFVVSSRSDLAQVFANLL